MNRSAKNVTVPHYSHSPSTKGRPDPSWPLEDTLVINGPVSWTTTNTHIEAHVLLIRPYMEVRAPRFLIPPLERLLPNSKYIHLRDNLSSFLNTLPLVLKFEPGTLKLLEIEKYNLRELWRYKHDKEFITTTLNQLEPLMTSRNLRRYDLIYTEFKDMVQSFSEVILPYYEDEHLSTCLNLMSDLVAPSSPVIVSAIVLLFKGSVHSWFGH